MREEIGERDGLSEKRMFDGLAFLLNGNMICGVHRDVHRPAAEGVPVPKHPRHL